MALNFPNPVRSFEPGRSCVSFWGSDASLEISFQIEIEALHRLGAAGDSEAQMLSAFDRNRDAILKVASATYAKSRQSYHRLSSRDFPDAARQHG